jgi:hypothetical protein
VPYTYFVADLASGALIEELPLSGVTFDKRLNDVGSLRAQLRVDDPAIRARNPRILSEPGRTAIYVDRDGVLLWGGIVWTARYGAADAILEIGASDFFSYLQRRYVLPVDFAVRPDVTFAGDQLVIAAQLVELAQSHAGGDLGIEIRGPDTSDVEPFSITYTVHQLQTVADAITRLANAEHGFDFTADVEYGPDQRPIRLLRFGYPRLGQSGAPHVWEYGANLVDFTWPRDAASMATRILAQGDGTLFAVAEDPPAYTGGWVLLEDAFSDNDIKQPRLLQSRANAELLTRRRPIVLPEITVRGDLDPVIGKYSVGDDARIVIDAPLFGADGIDMTFRLLAVEVTPGDDAAQETVRLTVAPVTELP